MRRYKNIPRPTKDEKILALYDTDNKEEMRWFWEEGNLFLFLFLRERNLFLFLFLRYLEEKFLNKTYFDSLAYQNITIRLVDCSLSQK